MAVSVVLVAVVVAVAAVASGRDDATNRKQANCGKKALYGKRLVLWVVGKQIPCAEATRVAAGPCTDNGKWSCVSLRPPEPLLVWRHHGTVIEARRYSCSSATVTSTMWAAARPGESGPPTRHQMLADDLLRCGQLSGRTYRQVVALLGRPSEGSKEDTGRYADWVIGSDRDSMFQVDSEYLNVTFDTADRVRSAQLIQG